MNLSELLGWRPSLLGTSASLLVTSALHTSNKNATFGAPGIATNGAWTLLGWRPLVAFGAHLARRSEEPNRCLDRHELALLQVSFGGEVLSIRTENHCIYSSVRSLRS